MRSHFLGKNLPVSQSHNDRHQFCNLLPIMLYTLEILLELMCLQNLLHTQLQHRCDKRFDAIQFHFSSIIPSLSLTHCSKSHVIRNIIKQMSGIRQLPPRRMYLTDFIKCVHKTFTNIGFCCWNM